MHSWVGQPLDARIDDAVNITDTVRRQFNAPGDVILSGIVVTLPVGPAISSSVDTGLAFVLGTDDFKRAFRPSRSSRHPVRLK